MGRGGSIAVLLLAVSATAWAQPAPGRGAADRRRAAHSPDVAEISSTPLLVVGAAEAAGEAGRVGRTLPQLGRALKGAATSPVMTPLVGIGAAGLLYESGKTIKDNYPAFKKHKRLDKLADALHTAAWGLQGVASVAALAVRHKAPALIAANKALGATGGALQTGVGLYRLGSGIRRKDRDRVVNGSLDVGAGLCWAAASCTLSPAAGAGFALFAVGKMAYNKRDGIRTRVTALRQRARRRRARRRARRAARAPRGNPAGALLARVRHRLARRR